MAKRGPKGPTSTSFKKGVSGNPGGKPKNLPTIEARKIVADVRSLAREYTAEAIEKVVAIMRDPKSPPATALGAATHILDRGWGKPNGAVDVTHRKTLEDSSSWRATSSNANAKRRRKRTS